MLEYNELSVYAAVKSTERPKATGIGLQWYYRLGHPGPEVIKHLPPNVEVLEPESAPSTTECEPCALAKAANVVSRVPSKQPLRLFHHISVDWFQFEQSYNGYAGCVITKYDLTSYTIVTLAEGKGSLRSIVKDQDTRLTRHYGISIYQIRSDNNLSFGKVFPA